MAYGGTKPAAAMRGAAPRRPASKKRSAPAKPKAQKAIVPGPAFFIDKQHFARKRGGDRIMPQEVLDVLVDKRGMNGDIAKITWADDSTGIPKGMQLDITISDAGD